MDGIVAIQNQYANLKNLRMPRTSAEAGQSHLPIERSAALKSWGLELLRAAGATAMIVTIWFLAWCFG